MKKILIDASRYHIDQPTGVEVYGDHIIDGLIAQIQDSTDIELTLIAPVKKEIISHPRIKQVTLSGKRLWTMVHLTLWMLFHGGKYDVLFVPSYILPWWLPCRSVLTIHDVAWKYFPESYSWYQRMVLHWSTIWAKWRGAGIVVPSKATARDVEQLYGFPPKKVFVIPHGFDLESFLKDFTDLGLEYVESLGLEKKKYLVDIARLERKKNTPKLMRSFLESNHKDWNLVLIGKEGEGIEDIEMEKQQDKKGEIKIMGYLGRDEAYTLLKHSGGLVFPSLYEGFGFPVLEAYALGVPALLSRQGSLPEVGGRFATYIENTEDFSTDIEKFIASSHALNQKVIMAYLGTYSWEYYTRRMLSLLVNERINCKEDGENVS